MGVAGPGNEISNLLSRYNCWLVGHPLSCISPSNSFSWGVCLHHLVLNLSMNTTTYESAYLNSRPGCILAIIWSAQATKNSLGDAHKKLDQIHRQPMPQCFLIIEEKYNFFFPGWTRWSLRVTRWMSAWPTWNPRRQAFRPVSFNPSGSVGPRYVASLRFTASAGHAENRDRCGYDCPKLHTPLGPEKLERSNGQVFFWQGWCIAFFQAWLQRKGKRKGKPIPRRKRRQRQRRRLSLKRPLSRRSTLWVRVVGMMKMMRIWAAPAALAQLKSRFFTGQSDT